MELKIEDYNGITVNSENFEARFMSPILYSKNYEEMNILKNIYKTTLENNKSLNEKELFDKIILNIMEEYNPDISITVSNKMCNEKPLYEHFNEYSAMFPNDGLKIENEFNTKESPHISIQIKEGQYVLQYEKLHGRCHVKAPNSGNTSYSIYGDIQMSDIKKITDTVKNINMEYGYDNSGKLKNYQITALDNPFIVIDVSEEKNKSYETKISLFESDDLFNALADDNFIQELSYIETQVKSDNEEMLKHILKTSSEIKPYSEKLDYITEFSEKTVKILSELKENVSIFPDNLRINTEFYEQPYRVFSKVLKNNLDSNCNIKITQSCYDTEYSYSAAGTLSIVMAEKMDNKISFKTDLDSNVNITYYGDMSSDFKEECIENLEEISNDIPELSKISNYVIEDIYDRNIATEDLDI